MENKKSKETKGIRLLWFSAVICTIILLILLQANVSIFLEVFFIAIVIGLWILFSIKTKPINDTVIKKLKYFTGWLVIGSFVLDIGIDYINPELEPMFFNVLLFLICLYITFFGINTFQTKKISAVADSGQTILFKNKTAKIIGVIITILGILAMLGLFL